MALANVLLQSVRSRQTLYFTLYIVQLLALLAPSAPAMAQQQGAVVESRDSSSQVAQQQSFLDEYVLDAGDQIRIDVFRLPEYGGEYEILAGGSLTLPMVGQVSVAGLTINEAKAAVSEAYASRLRRPIVNITLVSPRPIRIGIAGEITHPGIYTLQREGTQFPSLVDALDIAGGITQVADLRQITVRRSIAGRAEQTVVSNLRQFLETGDLRYDLFLRDGDTIFIPTVDQFDREEALLLSTVNFAADETRPLNIAIVGEVFRPGPYTVTGTARTGDAGVPGGSGGTATPPTVTRAIQVAGGIKPDANIRDIKVHRSTRTGQERIIEVNLWKLLQEGDLSEDIVLQEGDTIKIPKSVDVLPTEITELAAASFSPNSISVNVVGEVRNPGVIGVSPNTPLSQGILAAGGFSNRATRRSVELVRLNDDGTATKSSVEVDFSVGIDESTNPLLRNNDIIIVRRSASASISDTLDTVTAPLSRAFSVLTLPFTILRLFD